MEKRKRRYVGTMARKRLTNRNKKGNRYDTGNDACSQTMDGFMGREMEAARAK